MQLWKLSLKFAEQSERLEVLARIDIAVLSPEAVWRQNSFLLSLRGREGRGGWSLVFSFKAFNKLDEALPHYAGYSTQSVLT